MLLHGEFYTVALVKHPTDQTKVGCLVYALHGSEMLFSSYIDSRLNQKDQSAKFIADRLALNAAEKVFRNIWTGKEHKRIFLDEDDFNECPLTNIALSIASRCLERKLRTADLVQVSAARFIHSDFGQRYIEQVDFRSIMDLPTIMREMYDEIDAFKFSVGDPLQDYSPRGDIYLCNFERLSKKREYGEYSGGVVISTGP
jgi:hypothetical protein